MVLNSDKGYIAFIKDHFDKNGDEKGFYLGSEGLTLGDSFWVDQNGELSATKGHIASWTIDKNSIYVKSGNTKIFDIHPTDSGGYISYNTSNWNSAKILKSISGCFYLGNNGI